MTSRFVSEADSKDMIRRVCALSNRYFEARIRNVIQINRNKVTNRDLFLNIETIDKAIENKQVIQFEYLNPSYEDHKRVPVPTKERVSPYKIVIHNQGAYLIGHDMNCLRGDIPEDWRLDTMRNVRIVEEGENGSEYFPFENLEIHEKDEQAYFEKIFAAPYLSEESLTECSFLTSKYMLADVYEAFGNDITIRDADPMQCRGIKTNKRGGMLQISVRTTPYAMVCFAVTNVGYLRLQSPENLRQNIEDMLRTGARLYQEQDRQKRYSAEEQKALSSIPFRERLLLGLPILFGSCRQNADGSEEPVEWQVLEHDDKSTLLISKYILDALPYQEDPMKDPEWQTSTLRSRLRSVVKFKLKDAVKLIPVKKGDSLGDYFNVLSSEEVNKYFTLDTMWIASPTDYVRNEYRGDASCPESDDPYSYFHRKAVEGCWWLRDISEDSGSALFVDSYGDIVHANGNFGAWENDCLGVRPVIRVNIAFPDK